MARNSGLSGIENIDINLLIPYARNNRVHSTTQVDRIANSIKEFGFNQPIVIDQDNIVIVGHGRLEAAKKLRLKVVPIVQVADLTEAQKRAYRILDNKLQNDSEWDIESLDLELASLEELNFDLEPWGLDELKTLFVKDETETPEDDEFVPSDVPVDSIVKTGDLIELGEHRLLCGDSTPATDVLTVLNGQKLDLLLTDPPYGVSYVGKTKDALTVENDALDEGELSTLIKEAFDNAQSNARPGSYWYATVPAVPLHICFADDWKQRGILRQIMVWVKDSMVLGHSEYHYKHEPLLFGWMPGDRHKNSDRTRTTVWEYDRPKASREHPTMKPLPFWCDIIKDGSRKNEIVFDPFLGSGTTLIACESLGRRCCGIEISPQYCRVIIERYLKFCGDNKRPFKCKINGEDVDAAWLSSET